MNLHPSILCPIDFSEASSGALRYAAVIATHFATRLIVLSVEDPLLTEAMDLGAGIVWDPEMSKREIRHFAAKTFGKDAPVLALLECEVAVGKPAPEILRVARERTCELIVISSHGLTGARKLFFGSTTERVLRETTKPVLVTPPRDPGPVRLEDARRLLGHVMAPVDLNPASVPQTQIARAIGEALSLPLLVVHVIEPIKSRLAARLHGAGLEANRRALAEDRLNELVAATTGQTPAEALIAYGDPAEEAAKISRDRHAGLIVTGLHGSPLLGPRMGSVTYRLLCLSSAVVLALPPNVTVPRRLAVSVASQGADVTGSTTVAAVPPAGRGPSETVPS
jgi:nucleotide-binding universal stress UspA family protein